MFVGREKELAEMNRLYDAPGFQMLVLYGRRRVGKTTLIEEFSRSRKTLFFTAKIQVDKENLSDFSRAVYDFFGLPLTMPPFGTWDDAFDFVVEQSHGERIVVVFDEFPYAAKANASLPSIMQIAIDRRMKESNIYLILSGSTKVSWRARFWAGRVPCSGAGRRSSNCLPSATLMPRACLREFRLKTR